ncbi:MAG: GtrA family protein, partial [Patescibacteria group bacterium]
HDPRVVPQFFAALDGGADFVVGSRYIPGGSIPENWGLHRKIFSVVGNAIVRFGLGYAQIHDWTGGFRLFHRRYFEAAKSELVPFSGYVFQIAFLHKSVSGGARVSEVPIKFTDRQHGHSKIAPSQYIRDVLIYVAAVRLRRLWQGPFWKFCVVGTIGFVINTLVLEVLVALGFHPAAGSALGAEMAIISNFILNNAWTFGERKVTGNRMIPKFLQFNATSVGAIVIQAGTVWLGTLIFGVTLYRWYYILGVGLGLIWNYTMYSKVIWRK